MDSDGNRLFSGSLIVIALILLKGFFAASEAAITEISDSKVRSFEDKTGAKKTLFLLMSKPSRLITAFSVNRILSAVAIAYLSFYIYHYPLNSLIDNYINNSVVSELISAVIILLGAVLVMTVLCDGVPKKIACSKDSDAFALMCAPAVRYLELSLTPLAALSGLLTSLIARPFGVTSSDDKDVVTEEEILMMVDAGNETGVIEESQRDMINNIFEFEDLTVSDVMTHRTDIVSVPDTAKISDVVNASINSGFSRIPVYDGTVDHIVGIICIKDLLCLIGSGSADDAQARAFVRETVYVPETLSCGSMFRKFTEKKMQMAVVIDEYGGTAGIVTMEDVVESIVGNIQDEYDDEKEELVKVSDDTYTIDGTAEPEEIFEKLGVELPENKDYDTVSGFIIDLLGHIPEEGETPSVKYGNILFTVLITEDMCITKLKATILKENPIKEKEKDHNEEKEA